MTSSIDDAVSALRAGAPVLLPLGWCYALTSLADAPPTLPTPTTADAAPASQLIAVHSSVDAAISAAGPLRALHTRLVHRLLPGPAVFSYPRSTPNTHTPAPFTVPDERTAVAVINALGGRVLAHPILSRDGRPIESPDDAASEAATPPRHGPDSGRLLVLDAGPVRRRRGATRIELAPAGGFRVLYAGDYEERFVHKQARRTLLFVCTGNTCRSPMAEAIAADILSTLPDGVQTDVASAGAATVSGTPPNPQTIAALRSIGIEPDLRGSKTLTRDLIARADAIFAMTRSHLQSVLSLDPTAANKTTLLDEQHDIQDPIGSGQEVYDALARRLRPLIERRIREFLG